MRESILEATRRAVELGKSPTAESLEADFLAGFGKQSTNEAADPPRIKKFRKIVKTKSFGKVDGTPVDLFSASAVTQVYDALSKPANQRKYANMDPVEMISIAYKLLQKGRRAATSRETSQAGAGESKVPPQFLSKQGKKKGKGRAVSRETSQTEASPEDMAIFQQVLKSNSGGKYQGYFVREREKRIYVLGSRKVVALDYQKKPVAIYVRYETSQAGAGVKNAMAQAVLGWGAPRKPLGDVGYAGTQEVGVVEDIRLSKGDQKVIRAFADKKAAESKKLETDGTRLDGTWMGGRGIAEWKGGKIHTKDLGSRSAQTVQRALRRYAAKNDFAEIAPVIGALARGVGRAVAVGVAKKAMGKEAVGQGSIELFRKASGNQPAIYKVLNSSGGLEGFIEKLPDTRTEEHPWKAFGRTYGGKPGRGKMLGAFGKKDGGHKAAIKAVMKAG